jgi:hypothetical protein
MKDFLQPKEVDVLEEAHRAAQQKRAADRIKTILLLNEGYSWVIQNITTGGINENTLKC